MKKSINKGFSFGLTSGIITTLGLMVGLNASTSSKFVIIGGILSIAIADAFSDALGMHISVESEAKFTVKQIWQATISTFLAKFVFALSFILPVLLFHNSLAIIIGIIWGFLILGIYSYIIAGRENIKPHKVILEHISIALLVIILTQLVGQWVKNIFS
jgi:VIT1/CCC1 family predicted Fe2+/Mn2+ transporter